ncbi:MAG: pyridoxal phosphate-dependent class II aminotransferase [Lachnospiraceae bacterium]|nr:pyridoxal phosphate-dependent class II aminotransferase [Lachnospiraceae bacterium]
MKKHGGIIYDKEKEILDFSANIHPDGMPDEVARAMQASLKESIHYPDPDCVKLRQCIAKKHDISMKHVICGNGAADLIFHLAFVLKKNKILLPIPAFTEYEEAFYAASRGNISMNYYEMDQKSFLIEEDILDKMDDSVDILILCNPNNPTGQLIDPELLDRIMEKAKRCHIFVLLDECFLDFIVDGKHYSLIPYYQEYPNLFILKSFTKMYGIPGIRLGYGISADMDLIGDIKRTMQSWSVSHVAQAAGIAACSLNEYEEKTAAEVEKNRRWLLERLKKIGFQVWEGSANFLFFRAAGCMDLYDRCMEKGICIRHCNNYRGIGNDYYRVAVRTQADNERLIRILTTWKEGTR